jgi:transposase
MQSNIEQRTQYDEPFKQAAAHFFHTSGRSLEDVSAELGLNPAMLRSWKRKYPAAPGPKCASPDVCSGPADTSNLCRLRAENQALREEILHLKVQWDVLKTTLGILNSSAYPKQNSA